MLNLAIGRGPYICQSQSLNVYLQEPNYSKMSSMHFYAWRNGLKTGQYYLRSRPARDAIKFTVNIEALLKASDMKNNDELLKCLSKDNNADYTKNMQQKKVKTLKKRRVDEVTKQTDEKLKIEGSAAPAPPEEEEPFTFDCEGCGS